MEEHTNIHTSQLIDVRYHCHCIIFFSSFSKCAMYIVLFVDVVCLWVWRPIYWFADQIRSMNQYCSTVHTACWAGSGLHSVSCALSSVKSIHTSRLQPPTTSIKHYFKDQGKQLGRKARWYLLSAWFSLWASTEFQCTIVS